MRRAVILTGLVLALSIGAGSASAISPDYDIDEDKLFNQSKEVVNESIISGNNISEARADAKQFVDNELSATEIRIMRQHGDAVDELISSIKRYEEPNDNFSIKSLYSASYFSRDIGPSIYEQTDLHTTVNGSVIEFVTLYDQRNPDGFEDCGLLAGNRTEIHSEDGKALYSMHKHPCKLTELDGDGTTINATEWANPINEIPDIQSSVYSRIDGYTPSGIIVKSPIPSFSSVSSVYCQQSPFGVGAQAVSLSGEDIQMEVILDGAMVETATIPQGDSLTDGYETVDVSPSGVPECGTASYEIQLSTSNASATTAAIYSVGGTPEELPEDDGNDTVEPLPEVAPPENDSSVSSWGTLTVEDMESGALLDGRYVRFDVPNGAAIVSDGTLNLSRLRNASLPVNVSISAQGYYPRDVSVSDLEGDVNVSLKSGQNKIDNETPTWSDYPELIDAEPIDLPRVIGPANDSPSGEFDYDLPSGSGGVPVGSDIGIFLIFVALGGYAVYREVDV